MFAVVVCNLKSATVQYDNKEFIKIIQKGTLEVTFELFCDVFPITSLIALPEYWVDNQSYDSSTLLPGNCYISFPYYAVYYKHVPMLT